MAISRADALLGWYVATRGGGARSLRCVEDAAGPIESWWEARVETAPALSATSPKIAANLAASAVDDQTASLRADLARLRFEVDLAEAWPGLRSLPDPPVLLFRKGLAAGDMRSMTVVGARSATAYGLKAARFFAGAAAAEGVAIVSGMARGIDAAAHRAALEVGGTTIAVLGSGPDRAYPDENAALQHEVGERGTLLTEHPPGAPPLAAHFPRRNRLLAALGDAVLLVEARIKSGSVVTVRWAADLGKDVLVVPGAFDAPLSEAPSILLKEGATPATTPEDVFAVLGISAKSKIDGTRPNASRSDAPALTAAEGRLLALARGAATDVDELVRLSGEPPSTVLSAVLSLETRGLLRRGDDGRSLEAAS